MGKFPIMFARITTQGPYDSSVNGSALSVSGLEDRDFLTTLRLLLMTKRYCR